MLTALFNNFANAQTSYDTVYVIDSTLDDPYMKSGYKDGLVTLREALTAASTGRAFGDAPAGGMTNKIELGALTSPLKKVVPVITLKAPLALSSEKYVSIFVTGKPNHRNLLIDGQEEHQILNVSGRVHLNLHWVDLIRGHADYGGAASVTEESSLSFNHGEITKCSATKDGGAVYISSEGRFRSGIASYIANTSGGSGGAIFLDCEDTDLDRLTIANNVARESGGGVFFSRSLTGVHFWSALTITQNRANAVGTGIRGGGIASVGNGGVWNFNHCLVADNDSYWGATYYWHDDFAGALQPSRANGNLIGCAWGPIGISNLVGLNQVGGIGSPIDPQLSSLDYHGSSHCRMFIPNPNSPAIDGGFHEGNVPSYLNPVDQRGLPTHVRGYRDVGSVERQQFPN